MPCDMFGSEKFEYYLLGREVIVKTDHSSLEQIFKKNLAETPSRLQRLILRCLKFDINVKYKAGKTIPVADALSKVCLKSNQNNTSSQQPDVHFITTATILLNIAIIKEAIMVDPTMNLLKHMIYKGWPDYRKQCPHELWDYWTFRCELVLEDGLILKGDRIVIPKTLIKGYYSQHNPYRPPRRNQMHSTCQRISILARNYQQHQRHGQSLPNLQQVSTNSRMVM